MAGTAVDGDDIALVQGSFADLGAAQHIVDDDLLTTRDAGLTHAARHHGGVRSLAATTGQNTLRLEEAVNIFRLGFLAHQDNFLAGTAARFSGVGIEHNLAGSRAG